MESPNILKACDFIFGKLFDERTGLLYDHLYKQNEKQFLPVAEEIAKNIPNPCGWGTGMEDSVINGSVMLEAMMNACYICENAEERQIFKKRIKSLWDGLILCASVSRKKGYVARSVLPSDGVSHYINSSRDQYTHWLFIMYEYYFSEFCTDDDKKIIMKFFTDIAESAEEEVVAENDFCLLREDGMPAEVLKMWGDLSPHEYMRLPMIYACAYSVTGNAHWLERMREYRDIAIKESENVDKMEIFYIYPLLQMQYSLLLMYKVDKEQKYSDAYLRLMRKVADIVKIKKLSEKVNTDQIYSPMAEGWRQRLARLLFGQIRYGFAYYVPEHSKEFQNAADVLRNASESVMIQNMCPGFTISEEEEKAFFILTESIDFEKMNNYSPVLLVSAYYMLNRNKKAY